MPASYVFIWIAYRSVSHSNEFEDGRSFTQRSNEADRPLPGWPSSKSTVCVRVCKGNSIVIPNAHWHQVSHEAKDLEFFTKPTQRAKLFRFITLPSVANTLIWGTPALCCILHPAHPIKLELLALKLHTLVNLMLCSLFYFFYTTKMNDQRWKRSRETIQLQLILSNHTTLVF